ncbi:TPA: hypothetical protein EYP38_00065, partial [Candidatus Micrarchaeota archaeon]|nr:hypothetical protein [Candidatus Micrarchaeota archaeon]
MRVLIIGLDGFTWKTLDYMRKHVRMENLEKLMGQSAWGRLESTKPPSTVPAWISFATGVNPGKHGVFTFVQPASSLGTLPVVSSRNIRTHTFWELLRKRGMRSVLINLPCATPALTDDVTLGSFISEKKDRIHPKELGVLDEISDYRLTVESDFN